MKKLLLAILTIVLFTFPVYADDEWEIKPKYPDLTPGDGFMERGSWINPYILKSDEGEEYEIKARFPDSDPNDGSLDPGSFLNPYRIRKR